MVPVSYHWHWTAWGESRNIGALALVMRTIWYEALPCAYCHPSSPIPNGGQRDAVMQNYKTPSSTAVTAPVYRLREARSRMRMTSKASSFFTQ